MPVDPVNVPPHAISNVPGTAYYQIFFLTFQPRSFMYTGHKSLSIISKNDSLHVCNNNFKFSLSLHFPKGGLVAKGNMGVAVYRFHGEKIAKSLILNFEVDNHLFFISYLYICPV